MKSFAVAGVSSRAIIQHPAFLVLVAAGGTFTWFSRYLNLFGFDQADGMLLDIGQATLSMVGVVMVLLFATQGMGQEGGGTEELLMSKPIRPWEYLTGRYLGVVVAIAAAQVLIASVLFLLLTVSGSGVSPSLLAGCLLAFLGNALLASFAVALSHLVPLFMNLAAVLSIWTLGHLAGHLQRQFALAEGAMALSVRVLCTLVPNFENFNVGPAVVRGLDVPFRLVALDVAYGLVYTLVVLITAGLLLGRREAG